MTSSVAALNLLLGVVYLVIGTITLADLFRNRSTLGFSHFGAAFVALAFTCGPHHFTHGTHLAFEGGRGGALDLITVAVGLPVGAIWAGLRIEAFRGGRGDRFVPGTPGWLMAMPTVAGVYVTALVAAAIAGAGAAGASAGVLASLLLVGLYAAIAYFLIRTQIANRRPLAGWSLSGLALAGIFATCSAMHGIYAFYELSGVYPADAHMLAIDWVSVPAAIYFLWVVHALFRGTFRDWNGAPGVTRPAPELPAAALPTAAEPALSAAAGKATGRSF